MLWFLGWVGWPVLDLYLDDAKLSRFPDQLWDMICKNILACEHLWTWRSYRKYSFCQRTERRSMPAAVCSCILALFQAWTIGLHSIRRIAIDNQVEIALGIVVCLHSVPYIYTVYSCIFHCLRSTPSFMLHLNLFAQSLRLNSPDKTAWCILGLVQRGRTHLHHQEASSDQKQPTI